MHSVSNSGFGIRTHDHPQEVLGSITVVLVVCTSLRQALCEWLQQQKICLFAKEDETVNEFCGAKSAEPTGISGLFLGAILLQS